MSAAAALVRRFWQAMAANDWDRAAALLAPDARTLWPQTGEVIPAARFAEVQRAFPGNGDWRFEEIALLADGPEVVTDMRVINPVLDMTARVITFHSTADGRITAQREFWPDPYDIPAFRRGMLTTDLTLARY